MCLLFSSVVDSRKILFFSVWGSIQGFDDGWTRECAMDKRDSAYGGLVKV